MGAWRLGGLEALRFGGLQAVAVRVPIPRPVALQIAIAIAVAAPRSVALSVAVAKAVGAPRRVARPRPVASSVYICCFRFTDYRLLSNGIVPREVK